MKSITDQYGAGQAATGPARPEPVVSVRGLVKRYGGHEAVAGIDFEVRRGEIFAFLGPNGAGKTTTVEILEGFQQRTDGQVSVLGHDPATAGGAWRDRVGVVLQESEPEPGLSVRECLAMYAGFYRAPRDIDETIALAGLSPAARQEPHPGHPQARTHQSRRDRRQLVLEDDTEPDLTKSTDS
jgi:ABC-2 type transport system ATP-binding protein